MQYVEMSVPRLRSKRLQELDRKQKINYQEDLSEEELDLCSKDDAKRKRGRRADLESEKQAFRCEKQLRPKKERRSVLTKEENADIRRKRHAEYTRKARQRLSEEERALRRKKDAARKRDARQLRLSGKILFPTPKRRQNLTETTNIDVMTFLHQAEDVLEKNEQQQLTKNEAEIILNQDDDPQSDLLRIKRLKMSVEAIKMAAVEMIKFSAKSVVQRLKGVTNHSNTESEKQPKVSNESKGNRHRAQIETCADRDKRLRQAEAERKRRYRLRLSEEERALRRKKDAASKREKKLREAVSKKKLRTGLTNEEIKAKAKRKRQFRPQLSEEQVSLRRKRHAAYIREARLRLSEEERALLRKRVADRKRELKQARLSGQIPPPPPPPLKIRAQDIDVMTFFKRADDLIRKKETETSSAREKMASSNSQDDANTNETLLQIREFSNSIKAMNVATMEIIKVSTKSLLESSKRKKRKLDRDYSKMGICGVCNRFCLDLCAHMKQGHSRMKSFDCKICEKKCETKEALILHQQDAHRGKTLRCELCGNHFSSKQTLRNHNRRIHNPSASRKILEKIVCEHCGKSFAKRTTFREHNLAIHQGIKDTFKCKTCGESFSYSTCLAQHKMTVCEKDKAIAKTCSICGKVLANHMLLSQHKMNIHKFGNIEENACHLCNRIFKNPLVLYTHNNNYHSQKEPLVCAVCKKSFRNKKWLLEHWHMHLEDRPIKCNSCEKTYKKKGEFYTHKRNIHGNAKEVKFIIDTEIYARMKADFNAAHASELLKHSKKNSISGSILETPSVCQDKAVTKHSNPLDDVFAEGNVDSISAEVLEGSEGVRSVRTKTSLNAAETNNAQKNYDEFSTVNDPDISQTVIEKSPANCEPIVISKPDDHKRLPKSPAPPEINESEDDFMEDFFDFSGIMEPEPQSPMHYSENGLGLATEDKGPFIYRSDMKDPFKKRLVVELERLRSCPLCNDVFPNLSVYQQHMNSKGHRAAKRAHKKADNLVTKTEKKEKVYDEEKLKQLKEQGMNVSTCKICSKNYTRMRQLVDHYINAHEGKHIIKCEICNMGFPDYNLRLLRVHMTMQHKPEKNKLHSCDLCGETNTNANLFDTHMKGHNNDKRKCVHCMEEFRQIEMENHYNEAHNGDMPFACGDCPQKFIMQYRFELHEEDHRQKKKEELKERRKHYKKRANEIFPCPFCDKKFTKMTDYTLHSKEHKTKDNACLLCSEKFSTIRKLADHYISEHDGQNIVRCEVCDEGFLEYAKHHLQRHMQAKHVSKTRVTPRARKTKTLERLYACDICGEKLRGGKLFRAHLLTHGKEKLKCAMCDTETDGVDNLEMHYNEIHNGDMPFPCKNCLQNFPIKSRLELHMKKDHSEPHQNLSSKYAPAMCDVCGKVVTREYDLPKHKATHMPEETRHKFFCEFCGKSFLHEYTLTMHSRTHTGEKPYPCTICAGDVAFTTIDILNTHLRRVHNSFTCDICGESFERQTKLSQHRKIHKSDSC